MFQAVLCCGENKAEGEDQRMVREWQSGHLFVQLCPARRMFEEARGGAEIQPPAGEKGAFF